MSSHESIPVSSVVLSIDSKGEHKLCNETITKLLQQPNRNFQFDIYTIQNCLQANSIYASRKGRHNKLILTHST